MAKGSIYIDLWNVMNWIADRKAVETRTRSEHGAELILCVREVLENIDNNEHWQELFYGESKQ